VPSLATCLWVALGGALGSVVRMLAAWGIDSVAGGAFPWGTIAVNVSGSFLIGALAGGLAPFGRVQVSDDVRLFLIAGLCGGYTTFSAFSLQTVTLLRTGESGAALANVGLSMGICLAATWLGLAAGRVIG
jgi:CrcB protein